MPAIHRVQAIAFVRHHPHLSHAKQMSGRARLFSGWRTSRKRIRVLRLLGLLACTAMLISGTFGALALHAQSQLPSASTRPPSTSLASAAITAPTPGQQGARRPWSSYGQLPLAFEPNAGQTDPRAKFISRGKGYSLFLTPDESVLRLSVGKSSSPSDKAFDPVAAKIRASQLGAESWVLRMRLVGSNHPSKIEGYEKLPGTSNYFEGSDPAKWHTNIPNYAKVRYSEVYPHVDLVYYGNRGRLEHDFVVNPGGNPSAIVFKVAGADKLSINPEGDLMVGGGREIVRLSKPVIYQRGVDGRNRKVEGSYVLRGSRRVAFKVGGYNKTAPLIIDPVLTYSSFLEGTSGESFGGIAVDSAGSAYIAGGTNSADFPTTAGAYQTTYLNTTQAFVAKFTPSGSTLVYSTYLGGGSGFSVARGIAMDPSGYVYVTGSTAATDFPVTAGAFQPTLGDSETGFVAKLDPTGSTLAYSTYLGASSTPAIGNGDIPLGITVDASGSAYVTGSTGASTFPTTPGAFQTTFDANGSAFVTKLNPAGSGLVYSTFLGPANAAAIAVDAAGSAYVTGSTSNGFPTTTGAFQTTCNTNENDPFVTKLNSDGSALIYSTCLAGLTDPSPGGLGSGIQVDSTGAAYVVGYVGSQDFPTTPGAFQTTFGGVNDSVHYNAFVTKLTPAGSGLIYSTYIGGDTEDFGRAIAVDSSGVAYITGSTTSLNFPTTPDAQQTTIAGNTDRGGKFPVITSDAFETTLSADGSHLIYSTYLGGTSNDAGAGIAVDPAGSVYVGGVTTSSDFPVTPGAFQPTFIEGSDPKFHNPFAAAFVAKFSNLSLTAITVTFTSNTIATGASDQFHATGTYSDGSSQDLTSLVTWTSSATDVATIDRTGLATGLTGGTTTITATSGITQGTATLTVTSPTQPPAITSAGSTTFTVGLAGSFTVTATGTPAPSVSESGTLPSGVTFNPTSQTLAGTPSAGTTGTYNITFTATNGVGSNAVQNFSLIVSSPSVASLTLNPVSIQGGAMNSVGTVTLNAPAVGTAAQRAVALASDNTAAATVPASVTVAAGATSANFTVTSHVVSTTATANISATLAGGTQSAALTVTPPPGVASVTLNPTSVPGGLVNSTATVTLSAPAAGTAAQRTVTLASDNAAVANVPASVVVAAGATSANFTVTSQAVSTTSTANISATFNGGTQSASLTVTPGPGVVSLTLNPTSVVGGSTNSAATLTLDAPAVGTAAQRTVALASDNATAASVPATVVVAAGATTANFTVTSQTVAATSTANISATLNGKSQTTPLSVLPHPGVASLTLNPTSVFGGSANSTATVTLNAPAVGTAAQRTVTLASDTTAAATVPASVAVTAGATTATFTVTSHVVTATANPVITATLNGSTTATLTVNPLLVAAITLNPSSVVGGSTNSTATVTLNAPATGTAAQRTVTLASDSTAVATVPASVVVAAGATSANFTVTSQAVSTTSTANISATLNGGGQSAPLTVLPHPGVASLSLNPASVVGGSSNSIATVTLNAPAVGTAAQRTVTLASDTTAAATVPASVVVAVGATTATFTVTSHVVTATANPVITATLNGSTTATLTVNPLVVTAITLNPTTVVGGSTNSTATITVNVPAVGTAAQRTVTLASDNSAAASVPATVVVAAGATSATFTVTSHGVSAPNIANISATLHGVVQTSPLAITP